MTDAKKGKAPDKVEHIAQQIAAAGKDAAAKLSAPYHALVKAIAKANGHPDPEAYATEVRKHLEDK